MGDIENHRAVFGDFLHHVKAEHVDNQIVVAKIAAAIAQDDLLVATFSELINDVAHLTRADELGLLDVDDRAGFRHRFHQVSLTRQERGQLDHINHFRYRLRLGRFMHIGDNFDAESLLQLLENLHPLFQAWATIGVNRGAVRFIK